MRDLTISEVERLRSGADEADAAFEMDEDTFRAFYDRTARSLWAYLSRITGSPDLADDLLQEAYYRFLRAGAPHENDAHRRNSLFRIATNLARDRHRRGLRAHLVGLPETDHGSLQLAARVDVEGDAARRTDLGRALAQMKPRERQILWLAYAQGSSHRDIAGALGLKAASIRLLLFRARRKLARLLRTNHGELEGGRRED
jgi:RNA polymerase sigma-70 factor (ECF subfamily)